MTPVLVLALPPERLAHQNPLCAITIRLIRMDSRLTAIMVAFK
jgi:hypothetical protein